MEAELVGWAWPVVPELGALLWVVVSEGTSVAAALDVSALPVMSEGPSVAAELGALLWLVGSEELSVAAALDALASTVMPEGPSVAAELDGWHGLL